MWGDPEPTLREQLMAARAKIIAQLNELRARASWTGARGGGGPPDYRGVYAELEAELHDIERLLARDKKGAS